MEAEMEAGMQADMEDDSSIVGEVRERAIRP